MRKTTLVSGILVLLALVDVGEGLLRPLTFACRGAGRQGKFLPKINYDEKEIFITFL
jgi:hypothetical protein